MCVFYVSCLFALFSCATDLSRVGVYLGATQVPASSTDFTWLNGESVNMTATKSFWQEGHPKFDKINGVIILKYSIIPKFAWSELSGQRELHFICERPLLQWERTAARSSAFSVQDPEGRPGGFWCLPPVWDLRVTSLIPLFCIYSCSSAYSPVALSVWSFSAFGPFSWFIFP